ncbi:MAG: DUF4129 domain-containing protein [Pyrinomonadaceae bacterium]
MKNRFSKSGLISALFVGLLLFACSVEVSARDVDDFLEAVIEKSKTLREFAERDGFLETEEDREKALALLRETSEEFPEGEELKGDDWEFKTDNAWISVSIKVFEDAKSEDVEDTEYLKAFFVAVPDRLEAIADRVSDLELGFGRVSSKDEEKRRLQQILSREEFMAAPPQGKGLLARIMEWLRKKLNLEDKAPDIKPLEPGKVDGVKQAIQGVILAIAVGLIGFLFFKFGLPFIKRQRAERADKGPSIILGEKIEAGATTASLFQEAEALALEGNYRGAIRKGYISLLFELGRKRLVGLAGHKTNRDYLRDLKGKPKIKDKFGELTNDYEVHWYGARSGDENSWEEFKDRYRSAFD